MQIKTAFTVLFLATAGLALAGCDTEGPAERTGEQIDQGVERAGEQMEQAGERAGEQLEQPAERREQ
jgi:hyperosmotically inducible protein